MNEPTTQEKNVVIFRFPVYKKAAQHISKIRAKAKVLNRF